MGQGSLSGWAEGILLSLALLTVFGLIVASFNLNYGGTNEIPIADNNATQTFVNYIESSTNEIQGGTADTQSDAGITLSSSWGITKSVFNTIASFITGGWIEQVSDLMNLGEAGQVYARYLRILYILSLIFAILYVLFKVVA